MKHRAVPTQISGKKHAAATQKKSMITHARYSSGIQNIWGAKL